MAITVYSSLDSGAPELPSVTSQRLIDNLRLILNACLVTGYTGKPASGWTVGHDHTDGFSLSNGEGIINFVSYNAGSVITYLMETITDGSAALASGYNRRSSKWYEGDASTARQYLYAPYFQSTQVNKNWLVVADDKTVTLVLIKETLSALPDLSGSAGVALHFGRYFSHLDGSGFCCIGGGPSGSSTGALTNTNNVGTALRNPFTGLVDQGAGPGYRISCPTYNNNPAVHSRIEFYAGLLQPVRQVLLGVGTGLSGSTSIGDSVLCGRLRGLMAEPILSDTRASQSLQALGIGSPTVSDLLQPFVLPNGKQVMFLFPNTYDCGGFISLDPADWG